MVPLTNYFFGSALDPAEPEISIHSTDEPEDEFSSLSFFFRTIPPTLES